MALCSTQLSWGSTEAKRSQPQLQRPIASMARAGPCGAVPSMCRLALARREAVGRVVSPPRLAPPGGRGFARQPLSSRVRPLFRLARSFGRFTQVEELWESSQIALAARRSSEGS